MKQIFVNEILTNKIVFQPTAGRQQPENMTDMLSQVFLL